MDLITAVTLILVTLPMFVIGTLLLLHMTFDDEVRSFSSIAHRLTMSVLTAIFVLGSASWILLCAYLGGFASI